ncbi:MAG TPA: hypothetical protein PLW99_03460 [Candidatus Paceibacterota bacterium]|nr:hypothetical protein [Candidatus Paceibacterota bacterium]
MAKKTSQGKVAAEIAAGLAAAGAAAAAGYYFYGSKNAKKHQKAAVKWAQDMKKDVIRETKRLKAVSPKELAKVVDSVASTYYGVRSVTPADVKRAAKELKANLNMVRREVEKASRTDASRARVVGKRALARGTKTVKKVVKKAKKAAKKRR